MEPKWNQNQCTWLRPIVESSADMPELAAAKQRYAMRWNALIVKADGIPEFKALLTDIYNKVFDYYAMSRNPLPLSVLNRAFGKRWIALFARHGLPPVDMTSALYAASISDTVSIVIQLNIKGATLILPQIVAETIRSRFAFNVGLVQESLGVGPNVEVQMPFGEYATRPAGWLTDVPELSDVWNGKALGPNLSAQGFTRGQAPFAAEPVAEPIYKDDPPSDILRHTDDKFDGIQAIDLVEENAVEQALTKSSTTVDVPAPPQSI